MSIPLTGAGSLFVKLGHIGGGADDVNALRGGAATARVLSGGVQTTRLATLEADYAAGTAEYQIIDGFARAYANLNGDGGLQSALAVGLQALQQLAQSTIVDMANNDTPLSTKTLQAALALLIQQMTASADSVNASTVAAGAQTNVASPVGNPVFVLSVKNAFGKTCEYAIAETLTFKCTGDSIQGTATANQEQITVAGQNAQADQLAYNWATSSFGSGVSLTATLTDASLNNSGGNLLQNSEFVTATTANNLDNWNILLGSAGTTIFQANSGYSDSFSLQLTGDGGGTLSSVAQVFNTTPATGIGAGGTAAVLLPDTQYAFNCWVKCSATPAAGVLSFDLLDGSNAVFNDDAGGANTVTKSLTAVSTSWVNVSGTFRTPANLPATQKFRVRLSTAIDNGKSVFVDRLGFTAMTPLYAGGPSFALFAASTKPIAGTTAPDSWTMAITNTYGLFQKLFQRLFDMRTLGLQLPSSGSPTINDNLIL